ncbi:MAG: S26 family signal peptidase [Candidatus Thermoplasmatota archaeon]
MDFNDIKKIFLKFWKSENGTISLIRDVMVALVLVLIILTILWAYTGQWLSAPMVAIESGSMMHAEEPFGGIGYIDAGDMVLLVKVDGREDVVTHRKGFNDKMSDYFFYNDYGDVIIYRKYGLENEDQIIHRAMCWIEYHGNNQTYSVDEYGIHYADSITISELGLNGYEPDHSGFITQGDNPLTNPTSDQVGGICSEPIKPGWISGKARGEIPWVGTINLLFDDIITGSFFNPLKRPTVYNVPEDSMICLVLLIAVLISIPVGLDFYDWYEQKKKMKNENEW